jgi:uncharacterized protein (TIGR00369 family)
LNIPPGYKTLTGTSAAEDLNGPFYYSKQEGELKFGFFVSQENCNGLGTVHGGVLMMFADYAATMSALAGVKEHCSTISISTNFIAAARAGDWIEGRCDVLKRTGKMTFVEGKLFVGETLLLSFQAVLRRISL